MRSLLLAFFVGLALASVEENAFLRSRHYIFRYDAQLVTGSAPSSKLWSGMRLTCNVHLFFDDNSFGVTGKLSDVNLEKMDKFVEERTPNFFVQPEEKLLDGIEADVNAMTRTLEQIFRFEWLNGHVKNIKFQANEPVWSANIKRGVISLFEVNLDRRYPVEAVRGKDFDPTGPSYTVYEPGPFGECQTIYTPMMGPVENGLYLTKVRNYSSCWNTPPVSFTFNNFRSEKENYTQHLNMKAEISFTLKGDSRNFIILTAIGESKIVFTPYIPQDGNVETSINQTLYLIDADDTPNPWPLTKEDRQPEYLPFSFLKMQMPIKSVQNLLPYDMDPSTLHKSHAPQPLWTVNKMEQLLTWVANGTNDYPTVDNLMTMQTLIELMRLSQEEVLAQLLNKVLNYKDMPGNIVGPLKLKIYWDLLSACGTTTAATVQLDHCLRNDVTMDPAIYSRCLSGATAIGLMSPPSEIVITKMLRLTMMKNKEARIQLESDDQDTKARRLKETRMVAALASGSLIGRAEDVKEELMRKSMEKIEMINKELNRTENLSLRGEMIVVKKYLQQRREDLEIKHSNLVAKFIKLIKQQYLERDYTGDVIVGLKALRNAHVPEAMVLIKGILFKGKNEISVRIVAAEALEKFQKKRTEAVLVLEEVMKDQFDVPTVRIQCFRSLVNLRAPAEVFIRLAESIRFEKHRQVSTYVWTTMSKLANTTFRPYLRESAAFKSALAFMPPVDTGMHESQYRYTNYQPMSGVDVIKEINVIGDSNLVNIWDAASYINIFGATNKAIQWSMLSENVMPMIKKMIGPKGFLTNRNSVFDLLKRSKRGTNNNNAIADIIKTLGIKARDFNESKAYFSWQSMNNVIRSWDFSQLLDNIRELDTIKADINEMKWKNGLQFSYKTSGIKDQFFMELPSEAGFPVSLQMGLTYTANIKGIVNAGVEPSIYKTTRGFRQPLKLKAGLYLDPKLIGSLTGKMSVDGYLFQTGNMFHALVDIKTPFSINATLDLKSNHLSTFLAPPANTNSPVVKLEMKPYVYSRAVPRDLNPEMRSVNQRPVFQTMQPVMISNGAKMQQISKCFGENYLGYNITWQGQHLWRSLPMATAAPMIGRAYYALYITSTSDQPAILSADFQYLSEPRYKSQTPASSMDSSSSEEEYRPTAKTGPCDSWFSLFCYGTDEQDAVEQEIGQEAYEIRPIVDIPRLGSGITFEGVKQKIESQMGHPIPLSMSQWGFIAVFNSSTQTLRREASIKGLMQAWKGGKFHQAFLTFSRTAIPNHDPSPYKATLQTTTIYPPKKWNAMDLLDEKYQKTIHNDLYKMIQHKEHRLVNRYVQSIMMTKVGHWALMRQPSFDPQVMIDRIIPEMCMDSKTPFGIQIRNILQSLLPLSHQLTELRSEMKNALIVTKNEALLKELVIKIKETQVDILRLLVKMKRSPTMTHKDFVAAEYLVHKIFQCVNYFDEIAKRALDLKLVDEYNWFRYRKLQVDKLQVKVFQWSRIALIARPMINRENYKPICSAEDMDVIHSLSALSNEQLMNIYYIYRNIFTGRIVRRRSIERLTDNTMGNVTRVDSILKRTSDNCEVVMDKLYQTTIQHNILVDLLTKARWEVDTCQPTSSDRYALKVQTKQLMERGLALEQQFKANYTCEKSLSNKERQIMQSVQWAERQLVVLKQERVVKPSKKTPWTTDRENLESARNTLVSVLERLVSVRDKLMPLPDMPHPCIMTQLLDCTLALQSKVSVFKKILMAQEVYPTVLIQEYNNLDELSMDFLLSTKKLFNKYIMDLSRDNTNLFPEGNILISERMLDVTRLHNKQSRILQQLHKFFYQYGPQAYKDAKPLLLNVVSDIKPMGKKLEDEAERIQLAMQTSTALTSFTVYSQYLDTLQQQIDIYDTLRQQMEQFSHENSMMEIIPEVKKAHRRLTSLLQVASMWKLPRKSPVTQSSIHEELHPEASSLYEDIMEDDEPYYHDEENYVSHEEVEVPSDEYNPIKSMIPFSVRNKGVLFVANLTYGDKSMKVQAHGRKSVEQILWEISQFHPQTRDADMACAIQTDMSNRGSMVECNQEVARRINTFQHVHLKMESQEPEMPPMVEYGMKKVMMNIWRMHPGRTTFYKPETFITANSMQSVLDFSEMIDAVDTYMMTHKESMVTESLPLGRGWLRAWYPFQNNYPISQQVSSTYSSQRYPAMCKVDHLNVKTTDGAVYSLNKTHGFCDSLLAMDCSSDNSFAIKLQPSETPKAKILVILAEEHELQIIPDFLEDKVKIDGQEVKVVIGHPIVKYKEIAYGREAVTLVVSRQKGGIIHVEYPLVGLDIYFDFSYIQIGMSHVYEKQLCGLCGNFDGQITNELEGPDPKTLYTSASDFLKAYVIEGGCEHKKETASRPSFKAPKLRSRISSRPNRRRMFSARRRRPGKW